MTWGWTKRLAKKDRSDRPPARKRESDHQGDIAAVCSGGGGERVRPARSGEKRRWATAQKRVTTVGRARVKERRKAAQQRRSKGGG